MHDREYLKLVERFRRKQKEHEVYREGNFSQDFEKWYARGCEATIDWCLEQIREVKKEEALLAKARK